MNAFAVGLDPSRDRALTKPSTHAQIAHYRLMILMMVFALMIGVIAVRLLSLAIFGGSEHAPAIPPAARANITDRNGEVLAGTIKGTSLAIRPPLVITDKERLAVELARLFPRRPAAYYRRVLNGKKKFVYLERGATPAKVHAVRLLGEPAIEEVPEAERFYPQGTMASQAIGYTKTDGEAMSGMEAYLDKQLTDPANLGQPVALSIDSRVQAAVESALKVQVVKHGAVGGAGIVLDVHTGEILAMASLPVYNPNAPGLIPLSTDASRPDARYNRAISAVYELGSTFKMFTFANAIESGIITDYGKRYDATQPLQIGRFKIKDDHPEKRWMSIPDIMIHSSNIGTAQIGLELGAERSAAFFRKLGFDRPVDLELRARRQPLWPAAWAKSTVMTASFGHGIAISQLHLANAYAAMVNGGIMRPATMLKRAPGQVPAGTRVISEATSHRIRQLMRLVVTHGTGKTGNVPGFRIGGKTGTAEKPHGGRYVENSLVTTFAGVFPMDAPRYAVVVTIDEPKGIPETHGFRGAAWTALPAVSKIIARIGPMLGVIPDTSRDIDVSDLKPFIYEEQLAADERAKKEKEMSLHAID